MYYCDRVAHVLHFFSTARKLVQVHHYSIDIQVCISNTYNEFSIPHAIMYILLLTCKVVEAILSKAKLMTKFIGSANFHLKLKLTWFKKLVFEFQGI